MLAPKPSTAFFLQPKERAWLANRQDTLDAAQHAKYPNQGKWWSCLPGESTLRLLARSEVKLLESLLHSLQASHGIVAHLRGSSYIPADDTSHIP